MRWHLLAAYARRGVRSISIVVAVALAVLGEVGDAEACTCLPSEVVLPVMGARNVPLNVQPVVSLAEGSTIAFRRAFNGPIVAGQAAKVGRNGSSDVWRFVPDDELEPDTDYVLEGSGTVWFTTGTDRDDAAPMFTGATAVRIESMAERLQCHSGVCVEYQGGWHSRIQLEAEQTDDADYYTLEFLDERGVVTDAILKRGVPEVRTASCDTHPPALPPGERVCLRVIAYDLAANRAGNDSPLCEQPVHCETLYKDEHCTMPLAQCEPAGCCAAGGGASGNLPLVVLVAGFLRRRRRGAVLPCETGKPPGRGADSP